ncbi:hypothetical protein CALCODRAFT_24361 [Calocera cornea HHB12733]|uniref:F-box domain-containing protein n=1 Tax=Calocera cornea HHB12733 TaxID=1353952 RepID=A0A165J1N4_9BASI|nr:hypothetical protein CALCODRAFT_24361 [Calocera cornea HHB12733]
MRLDELPNDILECILGFLDSRSEFYTACLICTRICRIAQPRLYTNLHDFQRLPKSRRLEDAEVRIAVTRACRTLQFQPHLALGVRSLQLDFTEKLFQKPDRDVLMPPYTRLVCKLVPHMSGLRFLRIITSTDEDFLNLLHCGFRLLRLAIEGSVGSNGIEFLRQQNLVEDTELYCDIEAPLPEDDVLLPRLTRFNGTWTNAAYFVPNRPVESFTWSGNRSNLETLHASQPQCLALSAGPIKRLLLVSTQINMENLRAILHHVVDVVDITLFVLYRDCSEIISILDCPETLSAFSRLRNLERLSLDGRRMQQVSPFASSKFRDNVGQACPRLERVAFKGFRRGDPLNWDKVYCRSPGGLWVKIASDPMTTST